MKRIPQFFLIILIISFIIPSVALASWWNPFTWKIFNKKVVQQEEILNTIIIDENISKIENEEAKIPSKENVTLEVKQPIYKVEEIKKDIPIVAQNSTTTSLGTTTSSTTILISTSTQEVKFKDIIPVLKGKTPDFFSDSFLLADSDSEPTLKQVLIYAIKAGKVTGVRPAIILGIISMEADMSKKLGTCNRAGDPTSKKYKNIMPGPLHYANYLANNKTCTDVNPPCFQRDDQTIFEKITLKLGLDHNTTPVSCPIASGSGWGGAMGPSAFIPTTWKLFINRLEEILGHYPNPWNPEDSFVATGLLLKDAGADTQKYANEIDATCKYYSGRVCDYNKPNNIFYGEAVMKKAKNFQTYLDYFEVE